jgi:hypothetical protein
MHEVTIHELILRHATYRSWLIVFAYYKEFISNVFTTCTGRLKDLLRLRSVQFISIDTNELITMFDLTEKTLLTAC